MCNDGKIMWKNLKNQVSENIITKTRLLKYIENFTSKKNPENFQVKNFDIFYNSAQNIDYESLRRF